MKTENNIQGKYRVIVYSNYRIIEISYIINWSNYRIINLSQGGDVQEADFVRTLLVVPYKKQQNKNRNGNYDNMKRALSSYRVIKLSNNRFIIVIKWSNYRIVN